jgi:hypothetical protein
MGKEAYLSVILHWAGKQHTKGRPGDFLTKNQKKYSATNTGINVQIKKPPELIDL